MVLSDLHEEELKSLRRTLVCSVLAAVCIRSLALTADDATVRIPDGFFQGFVQPDNSVKFGYQIPDPREAKQVADAGWWNACAKLRILRKNNPVFRAAYRATTDDPALQATGVTFNDWSTGSQEQKTAVRKVLQARVDEVVARHGLWDMLLELPVDPREVDEMSQALRVGQPAVERPLLSFCAGSPGNVSVNPTHPDFPKLQKATEDTAISPQYKEALAAYQAFLNAHPQASEAERTAEINRLVRPVLATVR